jgi:hypothetical protein
LALFGDAGGFEAPTALAVLGVFAVVFFLNAAGYHPAAMFNPVQKKTKCFLAELPPGRNHGVFEEAMQPFLFRKSDLSVGQDD